MPEGDGGHVLITSRAHADWRSLGARPIALDVWEREESRAFLSARTGEHDDGVLDDVADALGDLPLALEQAAAYTNTKAITLAGYLQRLRDRAAELFAAGRPAGYGHTVATVWSLAFDELAEQPVARGARAGVRAPGRRSASRASYWTPTPTSAMTRRSRRGWSMTRSSCCCATRC